MTCLIRRISPAPHQSALCFSVCAFKSTPEWSYKNPKLCTQSVRVPPHDGLNIQNFTSFNYVKPINFWNHLPWACHDLNRAIIPKKTKSNVVPAFLFKSLIKLAAFSFWNSVHVHTQTMYLLHIKSQFNGTIRHVNNSVVENIKSTNHVTDHMMPHVAMAVIYSPLSVSVPSATVCTTKTWIWFGIKLFIRRQVHRLTHWAYSHSYLGSVTVSTQQDS